MDYTRLLGDSFDYTKEALWGRWTRWLLLLISTIIFPLIYGYSVRVMSGTKPAPEPEGWIRLFIDGIKLIVISLVYTIPVLILDRPYPFLDVLHPGLDRQRSPGGIRDQLRLIGPETGHPRSSSPSSSSSSSLAIVIGILSTFAAWSGSPGRGRWAKPSGSAPSFAHIGKIGWLNTFIALLVMEHRDHDRAVRSHALIPLIGLAPCLILLTPAFIIFSARYVALLYESGPSSG
jgi:hypothetical protein